MNWKTYEEVVKKIYEALGKDNGVSVECYGGSCKVTGKSTVQHQIDVLTSHSDGIHQYKTAIECKYWNENINKDIIMKVRAIVDDANLHKGVIVSKLGFTPDAITFAKHCGIGLVELREVTEEDWEGRVQKFVINFELFLTDITQMNFITEVEREDLQTSRGIVSSYNISIPDGNIVNVGTLADTFYHMLAKQEEGKEYSHLFNFPQGSIANGQIDSNILITGVHFTGTLKIARQTVEIKGKDHIWLVLKYIFEDKRFIVSKDGVIEEIP